jgi:hypothetical protein
MTIQMSPESIRAVGDNETGAATVDRVGPQEGPDDGVPLRVLGVAMIVDHRFSGARMLARYPTRPPLTHEFKTTPSKVVAAGYGPSKNNPRPIDDCVDDDHRYDAQKDELFFTLTPRQMAKLFRTKKALCGQPMTLRVNRTVFCCHAVLLDTADDDIDEPIGDVDDKSENASSTTAKEDKLCLFSVVVALSAPDRHGAVPFSSFWDAGNEDHLDLQRFLQEMSEATTSKGHAAKKATAARVSPTFLAIRRVHISISRYVRALAREESRCQYVSLQAESFFQIRNEYQQPSVPTPSSGGRVASSSASANTQHTNQDQTNRPSHSRQHSTTPSLEDGLSRFLKVNQNVMSIEEEQEKEQEILEQMLSAPPPRPQPEHPVGISALRYQHHGNLIRELVDIFHSLSRNDVTVKPTAASLLTGKETVIYVNKHIAIPIEPVGLDTSRTTIDPTVKPYNTLLFPNASPTDLLHTFKMSGSMTPQTLELLLLTVSPQKSLIESAMSSNLPLHTIVEMASFLVTQGVCTSSPVIRPTSRLSCLNIRRIPELALEFSEAFPSINIFQVVSFLTTSRSLAESLTILSDIDNEDGAWLRDALADHDEDSGLHAIEKSLSQTQTPEETHQWLQELEDIVYSLAIWLMSHQIVCPLQDYVVLIDETPRQRSSEKSQNDPTNNQDIKPGSELQQHQKRPSTPSSQSPSRRATPTQDVDDNLFREITNTYSLNGNLSTTAIAWQLGMDVTMLRSWAIRHPRIRLLWRVPSTSDDSDFAY